MKKPRPALRGQSLIERWAETHATEGQIPQMLGIVRQLEHTLEEIARGDWRGQERSTAGQTPWQMREEAKASIGLSVREPQIPRVDGH